MRTQFAQARKIVGRRRADGRIQAALALARPQHIPQTEAVIEQPRQAFGVRQAGQVFPRQVRQNWPQQIAWMGVILGRGQ
jgi:hypothetical protein